MKTASIFVKKKLDKNTDHFLDNSQIHYLKKYLNLKKMRMFMFKMERAIDAFVYMMEMLA